MAFLGFGKKKETEEAREVRAEPQASAPDAQEDKKGLFSRLWNGLSKTRTNVAGRVDELVARPAG